MLGLARNVLKCYQPPNINVLSQDILDLIQDQNIRIKFIWLRKVLIFFIVISRWWCHYFQNCTVENIGFRGGGKSSRRIRTFLLSDKISTWWGEIWNLYMLYIPWSHKIDPHKSITDVVVFYGDSNIQLGGELFKIQCPNIPVMHGVERNVSLFLIMFPKSQLWIRWL